MFFASARWRFSTLVAAAFFLTVYTISWAKYSIVAMKFAARVMDRGRIKILNITARLRKRPVGKSVFNYSFFIIERLDCKGEILFSIETILCGGGMLAGDENVANVTGAVRM